jgi:hypothetical protein
MKKHYKPKTKNVTKLKTYLDKKTNKNDRSKRHSTSRVS